MVKTKQVLKNILQNLDFQTIEDRKEDRKKTLLEFSVNSAIMKKKISDIEIYIDYICSIPKQKDSVIKEQALIEFKSVKFKNFVKKLKKSDVIQEYLDKDLIFNNRFAMSIINYIQDTTQTIKGDMFEVNPMCKVLAEKYIKQIELLDTKENIQDFILYSIFTKPLSIEQIVYLFFENGNKVDEIIKQYERKFIYDRIDKFNVIKKLDNRFFNECGLLYD